VPWLLVLVSAGSGDIAGGGHLRRESGDFKAPHRSRIGETLADPFRRYNVAGHTN